MDYLGLLRKLYQQLEDEKARAMIKEAAAEYSAKWPQHIVDWPKFLQSQMINTHDLIHVSVRGCRPSDFDVIARNVVASDNRGDMLFCEFSKLPICWDKEHDAQLAFYQAAIRYGPHCALMCIHNVDDRPVNALTDVEAYSVMVNIGSSEVPQYMETRLIDGNESYRTFWRDWYRAPHVTRTQIIETALRAVHRPEW